MRVLVRTITVITCLTALVGCGAEPFEVEEGFFGGVVADEPRAALIMRDVLVDGGRAADAAVAGFFALSVSLPSSAGIGSTGSCIIFDPPSERFENLSFRAIPSAREGAVVGLPLAPRAMFALHARYGRLRFEQLIANAEQLARFGEVVSVRLAADLRSAGPALLQDRALKDVLGRTGGGLLVSGERLIQNNLGVTLGRIRNAGVGDLYEGQMSRAFVVAVKAAGFEIDPGRLRDALPRWSAVSAFEYDNHAWAVAGVDAVSEQRASTLLSSLFASGKWGDTDFLGRVGLLIRAARRTPVDGRTPNRPDVTGATSFLAVDRAGQAVACAVGMGRPFGLGKMAGGTGIILRPTADSGPTGAFALIAGNKNTWQLNLSATAGGGSVALTALLQSILNHYQANQSVASAIAGPRVHLDMSSEVLYVEEAVPANARSALSGIGLTLKILPTLGYASVFRCVDGLSKDIADCDFAGDSRSGSLALFERE